MARRSPDSGDMSARKRAVPSTLKAGASFDKRSGATQKSSARGNPSDASDADYGPRQSSNIGAKVGDDSAGTRFTAGLPPAYDMFEAPEAEVPESAKAIASDTLPVPSADQPLIGSVEPWDFVRDRSLGKQAKR